MSLRYRRWQAKQEHCCWVAAAGTWTAARRGVRRQPSTPVVRLLQIKKLEPYVLHTTYVYGQQPGKRTRLQEAGLWLADPPEYYARKYIVLDITSPQVGCDVK